MSGRDLTELRAALRRPDAYPHPAGTEITVVETHISVLFFTETRVYKVKKPVAFDFLDYGTLDRRRHFCQEEVRLNRRLAPDVYIGVVPIVRTPDGAIRIGGKGETIEYAVEMVRLPDDRMMSAALVRGEIDNERIDDLVRRLAGFHRDAATGPGIDEHGSFEEIARQAEENFRGVDAFLIGGPEPREHGTISRTVRDHLHAAIRSRLADCADRMRARVREGRIREGHGDLHCGNICLRSDSIVIYDCIEFAKRFRCRDVAGELAFLAMDLDFSGFRGFGRYLLQQYAKATDDPELPRIAEFYKLHLAIVRGKVASLRVIDPDVTADDRTQARIEAMRYFQLATTYTLPPCLILMCGLPGTGKSHAARVIARPFEAAVLRSDVVRKELAGPRGQGEAAEGLGTGLYTPAFTKRTYETLLTRAADLLRRGRTVVVDATFPTATLRGPFIAMGGCATCR